MTKRQDIIIAGVGGQGLLTIAGTIAAAALADGLTIKQSEVHGMAQRGGSVVSHLRLAGHPIASDLIPHGAAHLMLATEPMESLRYLPYLSQGAWIVTSRHPFKNIANYPPLEDLLTEIQRWPHHRLIDADTLARQAGLPRAVNIVMLGAVADLLLVPAEKLRVQLERHFARKGAEAVAKNLHAFDLGQAAGQGS